MNRAVISGISATVALLSIYAAILAVVSSFEHALQQFQLLWPWMLLLTIGFGTQVGLFVHVKMNRHAAQSVALSGGVSTTSMVACCAHHVVDVLPFLGLSAAAVFLTQYQVTFIVLGILSNAIGITFMLKIIQQHTLYSDQSIFAKLPTNMQRVLHSVVAFSLVTFTTVVIYTIRGGYT